MMFPYPRFAVMPATTDPRIVKARLYRKPMLILERSRGKNAGKDTAMPGSLDDHLGFAPDADSPVPYMQRTRDYYAAIGYTTPYRWAHYVDAPFQPLKKPLAKSRVTIVTTAAQYDPTKGDQGPGAAYNGRPKF